jgi:glycosyltransferase involved in cell wall biosynthesis
MRATRSSKPTHRRAEGSSGATDRVSVFLPDLEIGGAERSVVNLCKGLASREVEVELVLMRARGPFLADVDASVTVVDLDCRHDLNALRRLKRYLRHRRPVLLLSVLTKTNVVAVWARALARVGTRVVVNAQTNPQEFFAEHRSLRHRVLARAVRSTYRRADGIVAVSEGVRRGLAAFLRMTPEVIDVAYNPIVTPELLDARRHPPHPWLDDGGAPVVVAVGRLIAAKDYPTLIRAIARVRGERPVRLLILGEGPDRPQLHRLVAEVGLDDDVAMPGNVGSPASSVARAAVYALSSRREGLPSALIEALPWGVPIVATDCTSGPREVLDHGRHGRLVPVGDETALASALLDALDGRIAPPEPRAWAPFTVEAVINRYLAVLGVVAGHSER